MKINQERVKRQHPGSLETFAWCPVCTSWLDQYFVESKFVKKNIPDYLVELQYCTGMQ